MELDYNFYALFETVGFIQAITLGSLLIILNKGKYKSTLFLGIFLVFFGLETIPIILESLNAYRVYPDLYLLPFDLFWFHFPLFFIYIQQVCIFADRKTKYWVLYPGLIAFSLQVAVFFSPYETKLAITDHIAYQVYLLLKIGYGLGIGFYTLRLLYDHKIEVRNFFSKIDYHELHWARFFLIFNISGSILYSIVHYSVEPGPLSNLFFLSFDLLLIYWVSYHGVEQRNVLSILAKKTDVFKFSPQRPKERKQATLPEKSESTEQEGLESLMEAIDEHMVTSETFIHHELTIVDLADSLKEHPKRISTAINTLRNQNFNTYVNRFRIKKAKELLQNEGKEHLSIEGIGNEVGFHSKSAFYSAFKKETGTTPTRFKEREAV